MLTALWSTVGRWLRRQWERLGALLRLLEPLWRGLGTLASGLRRWLRELWRWLRDVRLTVLPHVGLGALGVVGALVLAVVAEWALRGVAQSTATVWETRSALAGLVLQVLGLGVVARGLRNVRRLFDRPGRDGKSLREWFGEFPPPWVGPQVVSPRGVSGAFSASRARTTRSET